MSTLKVSSLAGRVSGDAPTLTDGAVLPVGVALTGGGGINVTGIITGSSYRGDGSQLTGIDASALKSGGEVKVQATATGAEVTGNLSVGGTLTYQDVQNVDSVGLVTARSGLVVVSGGASITAGGLNVTGVITATSYSGSGANLTGIDASPTIEATANGTIGDNVAVFLGEDGKVNSIILTDYTAAQTSPLVNAASTTSDTLDSYAFDSVKIDDDKFAVCWANGYIYCAIGTISGTSITFGTPVTCGNGQSSGNESPRIAYEKDVSGCLVIAFNDTYYTRQGVVALSFSGTTLTAGTYANSGNSRYGKTPAIDCGGGVCCAYWRHQASEGEIRGVTVTSGRVVTIGGKLSPSNNTNLSAQDGASDICYLKPTDTSGYGTRKFLVGTINGSTIYTEMIQVDSENASYTHAVDCGYGEIFSLTNETKYSGGIIVKKDNSNHLKTRKLTINTAGSQITAGSETHMDTDNVGWIQVIWQEDLEKAYAICRNGTSTRIDIQTVTPTSDTTVSYGPQYDNIVSYESSSISIAPLGSGKVIFSVKSSDDTKVNTGVKQFAYTGRSFVPTKTGQFIGFSADSYTNGQTAKIKVVGNTATPPSTVRPSPGFTTGTKYHITGFGTINTHNTGWGVTMTAGVALNSTTLLINQGI